MRLLDPTFMCYVFFFFVCVCVFSLKRTVTVYIFHKTHKTLVLVQSEARPHHDKMQRLGLRSMIWTRVAPAFSSISTCAVRGTSRA